MNNDDSTQLQCLLEQLRQGDDSARNALVAHAYEQLRKLARRILHEEFPRLEAVHEGSSILHETSIRLLGALRDVRPATPREFFAFASVIMRHALVDLARRHDCRAGRVDEEKTIVCTYRPAQEWGEPVDPEGEPSDLVLWSEFHETVEQLPPNEREVVDLHFYQGFTQAETAQLLGLHDKAVSRLWRRALGRMAIALPGFHGRFEERKRPFDA